MKICFQWLRFWYQFIKHNAHTIMYTYIDLSHTHIHTRTPYTRTYTYTNTREPIWHISRSTTLVPLRNVDVLITCLLSTKCSGLVPGTVSNHNTLFAVLDIYYLFTNFTQVPHRYCSYSFSAKVLHSLQVAILIFDSFYSISCLHLRQNIQEKIG